jgi:predicted ribosomally synthesized peptide with SipW-like signal peptide
MKAAKRRNIILLVASLVLVLSLTVGLTLAYFSDYTEAKGGKKSHPWRPDHHY